MSGPTQIPQIRFVPLEGGLQIRNITSQEAINFLTQCVWANSPDIFTPAKLKSKFDPSCLDFAQIAMPMIHPTTGETINSYKRLMHNSATAKIWQTAFGKDFGGMAQDALKIGQKGTNSIFVMTYVEIQGIPKTQTVTYAHVVVDYRPQNADPHCICITASGNLINYPGETIYINMSSMVLFTLRCDVRYGVSPRPASPQTNYCANVCCLMLLQVRQHPRPMETYNKTNRIHISCW
jgi:hypothetical protein